MTNSLSRDSKRVITVICPVYNEEKTIPLFYDRFRKTMDGLPNYRYQLIFTNNSSTDTSLSEIRKLQGKDSSVYCLTFSRNFGYQASVLAGMHYAEGDGMLVIDVDCEDPPEMIKTFVEKWEQGFDICYGIRRKRDEARWITWLRLLFYRVLKFTSDTDIILDMAEFALVDRRVRNSIVKTPNTFPFLRAEIAYSGFRKVGIAYDRQRRVAGKSNYNLYRMMVFALAGIMSVSTFPLRMPIYFFPILMIINVSTFLINSALRQGMFQLVVLLNLTYISGIAAAMALYIARIYKNGIGRPVYIVDWEFSDERFAKLQVP